MVPRVVTGVARLAFALATLPPTILVDTVPVTVPRVVTPKFIQRNSCQLFKKVYIL